LKSETTKKGTRESRFAFENESYAADFVILFFKSHIAPILKRAVNFCIVLQM
jgi:hypothetical protein